MKAPEAIATVITSNSVYSRVSTCTCMFILTVSHACQSFTFEYGLFTHRPLLQLQIIHNVHACSVLSEDVHDMMLTVFRQVAL